jgi:hypothetical protein
VAVWPRALDASALVTTEQESKLPAAAGAGDEATEAGTGEGAAAAVVTGALDGGGGGAEEDEEEDEAQAVSKIAAQPAVAVIATGRHCM